MGSTDFRVGGVVLCGGQSQRMGRSKAWLPFGNELLLQRVVRIAATVVEPVVVVAAEGQELPQLPNNVAIVRDAQSKRGPLQGLLAGLTALAGKVDAIFASSCDAPFLSPVFVQRMMVLLGPHLICVPHIETYYHPLAAIYRVAVREWIERLLRSNRLRISDLFEEVPTRRVSAAELNDVDPDLETLRNVNTPADYEQALSDFKLATGRGQ